MTTAQLWDLVAKGVNALAIPLLTALGVWGAWLVTKWHKRAEAAEQRKMQLEARQHALENLKFMQENSKQAIEAVQQMYPNLPNEQKASLAFTLANSLNIAGGVTAPSVSIPAAILPAGATSAVPAQSISSTTAISPMGLPLTPQTIYNESSVFEIKNSKPKPEPIGEG
jgi:hypothetical protein